ncbi:MAG: hypothetical protein WCC66_08180 [Rhizobiaceae bacterium]
MLNAGLNRDVDALMADDHDEFVRPLGTQHVAVVENRPRKQGGKPVYCDDFCRRMLLLGLSNRVSIVSGLDAMPAVIDGLRAEAFELRQDPVCGNGNIDFRDSVDAFMRPAKSMFVALSRDISNNFIRFEASKGRCLTRTASHVGEASTIIGYFQIGKKDDANSGGFALNSNPRAIRLIVMQRLNGGFVETYRRTVVYYRPIAPLLMPTISEMTEDSIKAGFWRLGSVRNAWDRKGEDAIWPEFLQKALNLELELKRNGKRVEFLSIK